MHICIIATSTRVARLTHIGYNEKTPCVSGFISIPPLLPHLPHPAPQHRTWGPWHNDAWGGHRETPGFKDIITPLLSEIRSDSFFVSLSSSHSPPSLPPHACPAHLAFSQCVSPTHILHDRGSTLTPRPSDCAHPLPSPRRWEVLFLPFTTTQNMLWLSFCPSSRKELQRSRGRLWCFDTEGQDSSERATSDWTSTWNDRAHFQTKMRRTKGLHERSTRWEHSTDSSTLLLSSTPYFMDPWLHQRED